MARTPKDHSRPLKQKTCDLYVDQIEYLQKLSKATDKPVQYLIRAAIDEQYGLPQKKD